MPEKNLSEFQSSRVYQEQERFRLVHLHLGRRVSKRLFKALTMRKSSQLYVTPAQSC